MSSIQNSVFAAHKHFLFVTPYCAAPRAGEPEPERGAMEPANFRGAGAGAGAFLNISAEPEPQLEPQKFY